MPIIQSVQVASVAVPLDKVTSFSTRTVSERHYCLVKVTSKDGHEGIGFCYVGSAGGDIAKVAVEQLLAPKLIGQNSHRSEGLWMDMYNESILQGRAGAVMRGISILDTAIWDLNARSVGLPMHHYLGAVVEDRVPAYASGGYYLDGKTPAKLGKEMESYVKQGFKAVKMKVGRLSPSEEEARVRAARKAIGEDVLLTLDANNAWRDLDLNARSVGLPMHHYLGAVVEDRVPAYASGGYYLDGKTPAKLGKEMESYVKQGFKAVKMKVGRLSPSEEEARVRAARKAIGEDVLLTLDANNAWRDLPTALEYVRRFEAYNPYWIEEPFSPDAIDLHAALARQTKINVATGEMEAGRWRFRELIDAGGVAILQSDAAVCGGITEWRRISAYADLKGITVCPHWMHDLHAPLVAATPNARFVEFFLDDQVLNLRRLFNKQLTFKNGDLILHKTPGLGFEFDEAAVKKYAGKAAWSKIT